jgi:hypothetical protein
MNINRNLLIALIKRKCSKTPASISISLKWLRSK